MTWFVQLVKMAALAATAGLLLAHWLGPLDAAMAACAALWLLLARVS